MTEKIDYTDLDDMIRSRIADGKNTFMQIDGGGVYEEANRLAGLTGRKAFRIIDCRLQAMRKRGDIRYTTKSKWELA